jgi:hypothetical protein
VEIPPAGASIGRCPEYSLGVVAWKVHPREGTIDDDQIAGRVCKSHGEEVWTALTKAACSGSLTTQQRNGEVLGEVRTQGLDRGVTVCSSM